MATLKKNTKEAAQFSELARQLETQWEYQMELSILHLTEQFSKGMKKKGISRAELAAKLGVSRAYITQLFRGNKKNLQLDTVFKLASALGMKPSISLQPITEKQRPRTPTATYSVSGDLSVR